MYSILSQIFIVVTMLKSIYLSVWDRITEWLFGMPYLVVILCDVEYSQMTGVHRKMDGWSVQILYAYRWRVELQLLLISYYFICWIVAFGIPQQISDLLSCLVCGSYPSLVGTHFSGLRGWHRLILISLYCRMTFWIFVLIFKIWLAFRFGLIHWANGHVARALYQKWIAGPTRCIYLTLLYYARLTEIRT